MNVETGIHYGVIPKNDLLNCAEEFFNNAKDMTYLGILEEIKDAINGLSDYVDDEILQEMIELASENFNEHYQSDCADLLYEQYGYTIQANNDDCDLFVIKSPYYTLAPLCSPCAPNACYLRDGIKEDEINKHDEPKQGSGGIETYCLPEDWFEDGKCPYTYWKCAEET